MRVPAIKFCFESAVTDHYASLSAMFSPLHSAMDENSRRSASATIQSPQKYDDLHALNYQLLPRKCSHHYAVLSAIFSPLHSIANEEQCKNHLCNQSGHHGKTLQTYCREAMHHATVN